MFQVKSIILILITTLTLINCSSGKEKTAQTSETGPAVEIPLANTYWKLVELNGAPIETDPEQRQEVHLRFQPEESRVSGFAGCNNLNGSYQTDGVSLTFGMFAMTMMACPNLDQETDFMRSLESVDRFTILGESLVLSGDDADIARLKAVHSE